jgi:hypothetical protein
LSACNAGGDSIVRMKDATYCFKDNLKLIDQEQDPVMFNLNKGLLVMAEELDFALSDLVRKLDELLKSRRG